MARVWQRLVALAILLEPAFGVRVGDADSDSEAFDRKQDSKTILDNRDEQYQGAQYITVLRRHKQTPSLQQQDGSGVSGSGLFADVSPSQLEALRNFRKSEEKKRIDRDKAMDEIPKTVLTSLDATEYVGPIGIGTIHEPKHCDSLAQSEARSVSCHAREQQTLKVVFDTGSTNLWMASTLCTNGPCVAGDRQRYDWQASETYQEPQNPRNLTIKFATATLIGPMGVDQFHIGPFTVKDQSFGLIQEERGTTFRELPLEGIVGLAFPSMSAGGVRAFFDNVIDQKILKRNMFAFYLAPTDNRRFSMMEQGGIDSRHTAYKPGMDAILWGGVDKSLYEGELTWFPVTQAHYWALDLYGFYLGDERLDFNEGSRWSSLAETDSDYKAPAKLIVDSGTAYYTAEDYLYHSFMDKMTCDGGRAPDLTYRLKDVDGNMHNLVLTQQDYMVAHCEPGFVKIPVPERYGPAMLLGELFMRKYFVVFDRGNGNDDDARIGFARSRPDGDVERSLNDENYRA
eukprot:TRINITY_DN19653_c0_g1_i1.p2 TRINITY_DN19653_c0_g1~~TRINITY_DN19653_c0_g1_i1.p2  ORF type:complete len:513 (-),score=156.06 TRINITY_DN19653_c0_g1_i1:104-1642(-)